MTEEQYDEIIAPQLLKIMNQVADMGGSFMAYASYTDDAGRAFGETTHLPNPSASEMIMHYAMRCAGNFDILCLALKKAENEGRIDLSKSLFLNI